MLRVVFATMAAAGIATAAPALTVIGTGTGTITSANGGDVIDWYGLFGARGASLLGKTATITISVELDTTPPISYFDGTEAVRSGLWNAFPGNDPLRVKDIGGGALTIGGVTKANDGVSMTSYLLRPPGGYNCAGATRCANLETVTGPGRFGPSYYLDIIAGGFTSGAPAGLFDVPVGSNVCERVADCRGTFLYQETTGDPSALDGSIRFSSLSLAVQSVPEPATWAMMVLGFGAIGTAIRRGRATQAVRRRPA